MDLDDLHLAVVIAREGSLAAAAEVTGVSQPTLSKAVSRLERATKVRLFERLARGMRPTEIGRAFIERATLIDLAGADLHAALRDLRQARAGVLRFGIGQGVPDAWIVPVVAEFAGRGVALDMVAGMPDVIVPRVAAGELEFALMGTSADDVGGPLRWQALREDPIVPIAPRTHALARQRTCVEWPALAAARWVLPPRGTAARDDFQRNFAAHGLEPPEPAVVSRSTHREATLALALGALTLVPRSKLDDGPVHEHFVPLAPPGGWDSPRRVALLRRRSGYLSPAAEQAMRRFAEVVTATA